MKNIRVDWKLRYLKWKEGTFYNKNSYRAYRLWVNRLHEITKKDNIEEIDGINIADMISILRLKYAPKNIEFGLSVAKNYFHFCHASGAKCLDPFLLKVPRGRGNERLPASEVHYKKLIDSLPKNEWVPIRDSIILRILHDTGCRISEALAIDFKNLDHCSATIPTAKRKINRRIFWSEETDKFLFERYIPIRICLDYHKDALFVSKHGEAARGRLTVRTFQRSLRKLCSEVGITGVTAHCFRHSKGHRMSEAGASLQEIANVLGHQNIQSSMKYLRLSFNEMQRLARRFL